KLRRDRSAQPSPAGAARPRSGLGPALSTGLRALSASRRAFESGRAHVSRADDLATVLAIARDAAAIVLRVYQSDFAVDYKRPGAPVTEADRAANTFIVDRLGAAFPGTTIVAEESTEASFAGWAGKERVFFVDPLDGTREFVAKNGEFAVMIGL